MPSLMPEHLSGRDYWRSLEEFAGTPQFREFMHREFTEGATEGPDSAERRDFLKIMGASMALAGLGLGGCRRWPKEKIVPFAHRPTGRAPGIPAHYATAMEMGGVASGLLVTSFDGRPIKIEGNPNHPYSGGATNAMAQASVLELYDPDRSRDVHHNGQPSDWVAFDVWAADHLTALENGRGRGLAILSEATDSPSVSDLRARMMERFPRAEWFEYEPLPDDHEVAGSQLAFGEPWRAHYALDRADVIVSLDADFLLTHPAAVKHTRDFAKGRRADDPRKSMSRLYAFESSYSLTGANADHRIPVRSMDIAIVAGRLAGALLHDAAFEIFTDDTVLDPEAGEIFDQMVNDLKSHRGRSVVIAGPPQPAQVHWLAHLINDALGNVGPTVTYTRRPRRRGHVESITALVQAIEANKVESLFILGGNPVFNAPADLNFEQRLAAVKNTVHLSLFNDETSQHCTWHLPRAHYLESWGDARAYDGTLSIVQPLIEPLYSGRSTIELLAALAGDDLVAGYDIVRRTFARMTEALDFEKLWRRALHDGVFAGSAMTADTPSVRRADLEQSVVSLWQGWQEANRAEGLEIVFTPSASVYDGRFANNGWLQELPDPLTKLTWDNAVLLSPATAEALGVRQGDMVRVTLQDRVADAAVLPMPGQHARSATVALGYGRRFAGRVCRGAGFDFYALRSPGSMGFAPGAKIQKIGGTYVLAVTQDHHAIDTIGGQGTQERLPTIFREATREKYVADPGFANNPGHTHVHVAHRLSLFNERHPFQSEDGIEATYAWGMSIDLSTCTGCAACVVACQAENNIPIVGKDQVKRGREMHWIRVDRYFKGSNPQAPAAMALQPVPCMQCENAACEQVCPVAATVHDKDGLNVMVYNRCIGTRYCSNNCPYKVRRFNYFDYHRRGPLREQPGTLLQVEPEYYTKEPAGAHPLKRMQFNPEVTVRIRGVMEKCTYCVQRISAARIEAKNEWVGRPPAQRPARVTIPDGTVTPACAQACPAEAIVFGDLNDPASRVATLHRHDRSYQMLEETNSKPRTRYLAKLRNPATGRPPLAEESSHG
ncbi:MAG: TAT-variant-translocated molybdopterin oxidoreductase [Planctomycetota bacterium]